ncbi:hypothetical protein LTR05_000454 [Lithohypha guttulata]|uniref:Glycosyltransferase 2-like domain-containing protein n=1 Tax=Lithohypha guttulata TaxID=1690604 RepID=A0AAN7Y9D1_9EURO|nr:hypothetical protein LTR05_000454 [Lithohypha guttulata]
MGEGKEMVQVRENPIDAVGQQWPQPPQRTQSVATQFREVIEPADHIKHSTQGSTTTLESTRPYHKAKPSERVSTLQGLKHEVMVNYLYQKQATRLWAGQTEDEGVVLRRGRGEYLACPSQVLNSAFGRACLELNLPSAMTVRSRTIETLLASSLGVQDIPLQAGLRMQVVQNMADLAKARTAQCGAFIADLGLLVVWDDDPNNLINRATDIEEQTREIIWQMNEADQDEFHDTMYNNKMMAMDDEAQVAAPQERPTHLLNTILVAFCLIIVIVLIGLAARSLATEIAVDKSYIRLAVLALIPVQVFFTLFFAQVIVGCISQCCGPIRQMQTNSKFYSAVKSPRLRSNLPHVTIQCPVYKEGLSSVIAPTVKSIKQAISTYELQGGSANIFINDDGMQIIDEAEREARMEFYADNNIGWTARPKHGSEGFLRRGKFKKASNMNYGLMLSCNVEEKLLRYERRPGWNQNQEDQAYSACLQEVLEENPRAWSAGNIRVGDYILLIDSDTRVPSDCLLDAASEMEQSPNVGIMQFSSGVMQVVNTFFENGITFFTNMIYTAIKYTVSNGDVAPFVGHNAILRWSAIQQVSYMDEDGYEKFWSESHVSEDFDMSLRLQCDGYIIRLAAWAGEGFKEGVSLTVYDELARWEKYAYGCNELLFHPIRKWIYKGPFTPLFRRFLFSNIRFTSKITIVSYIGTYYAIGAAWIMTLANYFAIGWFNGYLDKYYIDSWKVWVSIIVIFNGLGNFALAVMRYRTSERSFFGALLENIKWIPLLSIFLGGLSLHVSSALLAHMFEINMTWGATSKEAEFSNFFIEVPKVLKRFKWSIAFALLSIAMMVIFACADFVPWSWRIKDFIAILPMSTVAGSHLLMPIVLNPALMTFTF